MDYNFLLEKKKLIKGVSQDIILYKKIQLDIGWQ